MGVQSGTGASEFPQRRRAVYRRCHGVARDMTPRLTCTHQVFTRVFRDCHYWFLAVGALEWLSCSADHPGHCRDDAPHGVHCGRCGGFHGVPSRSDEASGKGNERVNPRRDDCQRVCHPHHRPRPVPTSPCKERSPTIFVSNLTRTVTRVPQVLVRLDGRRPRRRSAADCGRPHVCRRTGWVRHADEEHAAGVGRNAGCRRWVSQPGLRHRL